MLLRCFWGIARGSHPSDLHHRHFCRCFGPNAWTLVQRQAISFRGAQIATSSSSHHGATHRVHHLFFSGLAPLLLGSVIMATQDPQGAELNKYKQAYYFLSLGPVGLGFFCMCVVVLVCEAGTYYEVKARNARRVKVHNREVTDGVLSATLLHAVPEFTYSYGYRRPENEPKEALRGEP